MLDVSSQGLMSDFEDADFCLESWTLPKKKKRKNESKKHKKDTKCKSESGQKNKKNDAKKPLKFDETTMEMNKKRKEKGKKKKDDKKGKKKRKKKLELDGFPFLQVTGVQAKHVEEPAASKPDDPGPYSKKKNKKRKMVAFALSPADISFKHLEFSPSPTGEDASCSQVSVTGHSQIQPHDGESQCASDEINSQDLFITQKTFRTSPVEASSSEASDRPAAASPPVFRQRSKGRHKAAREIKQTHPQISDSHQPYGASHQPAPEAEDEKTHLRLQLEKASCRTQTKFKANLAGKTKAFRPNQVNPVLNEPVIISPTPVVSSNQRSSSSLPQLDELSPLPPCRASASTQTENFFTSELSSYLSFCQATRTTAHSEDEKPLDLSFPQRARKDLRLSAMSAMDIRNGAETLRDQKPPLLPGKMKDDEVRKDSPGQRKTSPSPQSDADLKSADTTTSSEDDHNSTGRRDPIQVKGVQMRLNKPFFFKTKGEGQLSRPASPLMKFSEDIEVVKPKKRH